MMLLYELNSSALLWNKNDLHREEKQHLANLETFQVVVKLVKNEQRPLKLVLRLVTKWMKV